MACPTPRMRGPREILAASAQVASLIRQGTAVLVGSSGSSLKPHNAQHMLALRDARGRASPGRRCDHDGVR